MRKDISPAARKGTVRKARSLRREMSLPEILLWQVLRGEPDGLSFRRQHPSGPYVIDFFCIDARLAIEIDGQGHDARVEHDARRDTFFMRAGIRTMRVPAVDVLRNLDAVVRAIVHEARARLPLHQPSATACSASRLRGCDMPPACRSAPLRPPPRDKLGEE